MLFLRLFMDFLYAHFGFFVYPFILDILDTSLFQRYIWARWASCFRCPGAKADKRRYFLPQWGKTGAKIPEKSGQMTGQIPQTAGKPFPAHFFDQRPSFCIPWGIFCRTGVLAWLGIGSLRAGGLCRAGWKCLRPKTVCCRCWQLRCYAAGRCGCKMCRA